MRRALAALALAACASRGPADAAHPASPPAPLVGRADASAPPSAPAPSDPLAQLGPAEYARAVYQELVEIDTSPEHGTTRAANAVAARLALAGFPEADVRVLGPDPTRGNVVARLRGTGKRRPLLLLAHLDVVEARREDWTTDPFTLVEKDGYFYGRGSIDDKAMAAIWLATLVRFRREGFAPDRDLVMALTADEEEGEDNGVEWLLAQHRELVDAAYALNEGGGGDIRKGRYMANLVQLSEKLEIVFELETVDKGGDASQPRAENAIYRLSAALARLATLEFPLALNDVTRGYFARLAEVESDPALARDMRALGDKRADAKAMQRVAAASTWYNSMLRTTCAATLLEAGHGEAALPQRARATLDCRALPGVRPEEVERAIARAVADPEVKLVRKWPPLESPPSPLLPELMAPVERLTKEMWPGVVVATSMLPAATDAKFLRAAGIPTYGVSGLFEDVDDVREHGKDERLGVKAFHEGREFLYRLVKALSQ